MSERKEERKAPYNIHTYIGLMVNGQAHEAVEYLEQYPHKRRLARKLAARMSSAEATKRVKNELVARVDAAYQAYYKSVFWQKKSDADAEAALLHALSDVAEKSFTDLEQAEAEIGKLVERNGYRFLGGKTQGYYGAYIWKKTKPKTYQVVLPHTVRPFTIKMMYGFVSRSWLDYLTLGRIGTGGWAEEDGLCCVWKSYVGRTWTEKYRVSFLKHEAQHTLDYALFDNKLSGTDLEYRAKTVELIYAKKLSRLAFFVGEAAAYDGDTENSHASAAARLIGELSERVFGEPAVYDMSRWKDKRKQVRTTCLELYDAFCPNGTRR